LEKAFRILIAEDDVLQAHALEEDLLDMGYDVVGVVATGTEAVEKARATKPHLALVDVRLKGDMDGVEAAWLTANRGATAVVYLTALYNAEIFARAKQTAPYGYINKPASRQELQRTLDMPVNRYELERRLTESEERFPQAAENAQQWIWEVDADGVYTYSSPTVERILGYDPQEVVNLLAAPGSAD